MTVRFRAATLFAFAVLTLVPLFNLRPASADTGLARHKKLYAVPAPGKVVIDGKLNDWDLSGQIKTYVISETSDMQSAKFAMMYDKRNLYVSAVVRDPSPMMNRHDPTVDADKGWDADSCQLRLTLDPKMGYPINIGYGNGDMANPNVVHMTLWYYTDNKEPCLQIMKSMNYKPVRPEWAPYGAVPAGNFQASYVKADDGRGYTFEYAIPWATLGTVNPPKAGDIVAGTVQFNYGLADGLHTAGGSAWCYDVLAGPGFPYQSTSCWGKIIFSAKGHLSRDLVEEGVPPTRPLPLKFTYDLPSDGQITIELCDSNNVVRRILVAEGDRRAGENVELWDGADQQGNSLPAGTYTVKGIIHQPITQKFLFSPHNSGVPPYKTDDGTGAWGGDEGNPEAVAAFDDGVIMSWGGAEAGSGIIRTDLNGRKKWGTIRCATFLATDGIRIFTAGTGGFSPVDGVNVLDIADSRPINFGNGQPNLQPPDGGDAASNLVTGLAYGNGVVYVSYAARNLIARYNATSGKPLGNWAVPSPGSLATTADTLVAVSDGKVVAIHDGASATLMSSHLDDPRGMAIGGDGDIYVANGGSLQNVSVFSPKGDYLRSIGKPGGRPAIGKYDPTGMYDPGGISVDKNGHLWVAERQDSPKRISEWDASSGDLVNEFFGACSYFGYSYIDPAKSDEIYCHNVIWKIDWLKNTCAPFSTIWRQTSPNMMDPPGPAGYNEHPKFFTAANSHQYSYGNGHFMSVLSMRDGLLYKPLCAFLSIDRGYVYFGSDTQFPVMQDAAKYPNGSYFWQDLNGDQTIEANELVPLASVPDAANAPKVSWYIQAIDPHMTIWLGNGYTLKPKSWDGDRPIYDPADVQPTFLTNNPDGGAEWLDPDDGGIYTLGGELSKWSADGKQLWAFPGMIPWESALSKPIQAPGTLYGLTNPLGVAGDFTGTSCYFGTYHLITKDGIYACMLMRDARDGKGYGADVTASETLTGQIVKLDNLPGSQGKSRYFLLAGASDARVTEIFGLDTVKRLPGGTLTLTDADVKTAADAAAEYDSELAKTKRLSIARGLSGLASATPITHILDDTRSFTVRAAADDMNLYMSFDVTSPTDLINSAPDPHTLFKGGNCLDIQMATDPNADPKRKTPAPGDFRLLVTRQLGPDGKTIVPFAVLYRPKIKGFTGTPIMLKSPTGSESFDSIDVVDSVGLQYKKTPSGYSAVVTIPLSLIGLTIKPEMTIPMDVGIVFGNSTGNQVTARAYWINNSFDANVTNDIPDESRLEPSEWGIATTE